MNPDLEKARELLRAGELTCALCRAEQSYTSHRRGVAPLLELVDAGKDLSGFSAADKVVGRATALLYCLLGVRAVWGGVMSQGALEVLRVHRIDAGYETLVPFIQNRAGDGICPMEAATTGITDPEAALQAVRVRLAQLQK